VGADIYNSTFLKVIGDFTWGILDIVPKDREGRFIESLKTARVDRDKNQEGLQELKEWMAVIEYIRSFPDKDGDGLPDVPDKYRAKLGRQIVQASWNPYHLLRGGNYLTWIVFGVAVVGLLMVFLLVRFTWKRLSRR
jgi:5'-nucleotidase/UDP-sugar diphosphatase